jgi:hypothetical protein
MSLYEAVAAALSDAANASDFDTAAAGVLRLLGSEDQLLAFAESAAAQTRPRQPRGYLHSNRFLKVEYLRVGAEGLRLRAHYWHHEWGSESQNPHNHAFDFRSRVVLGTFLQRRFAVSGDETASSHFGYSYSRELRAGGVDEYRLQPSEPVRLVEIGREEICPPSEYSFSGRSFHTLDPINTERGATILVAHPDNQHPWSDVYSTIEGLHRHVRNARELGQAELLNRVYAVLLNAKRFGS